jgi:hypothetical protein
VKFIYHDEAEEPEGRPGRSPITTAASRMLCDVAVIAIPGDDDGVAAVAESVFGYPGRSR